MKIKMITASNKFLEDNDYRALLLVEVDGKRKIDIMDGEPEDSTLSRNFNDIYSIVSLMKSAYTAGKNGEDLQLEEVKIDCL